MRKAAALGLLASTWVLLLFAASEASHLHAVNLEASCATLDLSNDKPDHYNEFINTLIDELSDEDCFGLPMLRPPIQINGKDTPFPVLRKVMSTAGKLVTLVINSNTLDLIGYADQSGDVKRFFQFNDAPGFEFPNHQVIELPYGSSIADIQKINDAIPIDQLPLSRALLDGLLNVVHGVEITAEEFGKDQVKFLASLLRMIVGGARFKYIQEQVSKYYNDEKGYLPDQKMQSIEGKWGQVSQIVAGADAQGVIPDFFTWPVNKVADVKGDIAVVKYATEGVCAVPPLPVLRNWFPTVRRHMRVKRYRSA